MTRIGTAIASLALFASAPAFGQSAKNAVQVGDVALLSGGPSTAAAGDWTTIMYSGLKTANDSDAIVGVTLEAGLFTSTTVKSKGGSTDSSSAEAMIEVRVLIDGVEAAPGSVTFARRNQTLMAKFAGVVDSCSDADGDGTITFETECTVTDEELTLVLDTMNANAFNFILADLSSGYHEVEVQARVTTNTSWDTGSADASAVIGKGSVMVEEVRLVKGTDISL